MGTQTNEELLRRAVECGRSRDYRRACLLLERILSETDTLPEAMLYLGRSYHALGEYNRAVPILKAYLRSRGESEAGYFFLGRSYMALNHFHQASAAFRHALEINPGSAISMMYLGYAYLKSGVTDSALSYFGRAVELRPWDERLYAGYLNTLFVHGIKEFQKGNLDLSLQMLNFYHAKGGDNLLLHLYLGLLEREIGSPEKALEHYNRAVAEKPDDASIRFQRAETLVLLNHNDEALSEIEDLLNSSDQDISVDTIESIQRILAVTLFQKAQYRRAIHFAVKVLKRGADPDLHLLIGEGYRHLGDFEKATNHYRRARRMLPDRVEPLYGLAVICWESENWAGMLDILRTIERMHPEDDISAYYTPLCLVKTGHPVEETMPLIQKELGKNDSDPYLLTVMGSEYLRAEQYARSEEWFLKALSIDRGIRGAYSGLIAYYEIVGDDDKLIGILNDFIEQYPSEKALKKKLITLLVRNKLYDEAVGPLESYLASVPEDTAVKRTLAFCLRETAHYRKAALWYRRLLAADPGNEVYLRSLVYCLRSSGRVDEAVRLLEHALDYLKNPSWMIPAVLSKLYNDAGRLADAVRMAHRALDEDPNNYTVMKNLSIMYRKMGIDEFADRYAQRLRSGSGKNSCPYIGL